MPKHLYLLRHGQSTEKQMGETDKERELSPQGMRESVLMGTYLLKQKTLPEVIFSSEAQRAKASANMVADTLKIDSEKIIYHEELFQASTRTFLELINQLDDSYHHVMFVAHNPTVSYLAEYITKAEIGDMTPSGLAIIRFSFNSWKEIGSGTGELVRYIYPSMLIND
jgi:phosphohistidine phosphatase